MACLEDLMDRAGRDGCRDAREAYEGELLARYCRRVGDMWAFKGEGMRFTRAEALDLIRAFLGLGLAPTSIFSAQAFAALYDRVAALEQAREQSQLKG